MALVATPIGIQNPRAIGDLFTEFYTLAFSGSYSTGGEAWDPLAGMGGPAPQTVFMVIVGGGAGYDFEYDTVNKKLKLFSSANTELAAGAYNAALTGDTLVTAQVIAR
jgi:hypothetical protein